MRRRDNSGWATGQDRYEEVDIVTRGSNYGWNIWRLSCYSLASRMPTNRSSLPVTAYDHSRVRDSGRKVYGEKGIPSLQGAYVYGDYALETLALKYDGTTVTYNAELVAADPRSPRSASIERKYLRARFDGKIYQLARDLSNRGL